MIYNFSCLMINWGGSEFYDEAWNEIQIVQERIKKYVRTINRI